MPGCPTDDALLDFAAGRLAGAAAEAMLEHLDGCTTCQAALDAAVLEEATAPASRMVEVEEAGGAPPELASGARVGRYTVLQRIGAGGMGVVYAAYDPELDRRVALKLLRPGQGPSSDEARARLTREARAMARLTHPNVVAVHDAGAHGSDLFVAMELVEGSDLRRWVRERKPAWPETLRILIAAGQGLAAAHRAGLVHRDVKPDNILVGADGQVRVTDFGLARSALALEAGPPGPPGPADAARELAISSDEPTITRHGAVVGTPAYLAPEQLRNQPAGPLSDQFSFCVTAFEALHGRRPFGGAERERMAKGEPVSPRDPPPDSPVPARLRAVVRRGLELDPAKRFPSMDALLGELAGRRARTRRRVAAVSAALVAMGAAGFAASVAMERVNACRRVPEELAGVWDDARRRSLQAAFARTGAPYAPGAWEAVQRSLDAYGAAWVELGTAACEASRRDASVELPLLQRVCLQHRRTELRSLVEVLGEADAKVVASSVDAVSALTPIARCADAAALRAPIAPPKDAESRAKVEALREKLARVKALYDAGRYPAALPAAQAAVAEAQALEYPPVLAEALIRQGKAQLVTGAAKDAVPAYERAELAAEESRDERGAAEAAVDLVQALTVLGRLPEGQQWQRRAEAYLRRLGRDDELQAALLSASAQLSRESGHIAEAVEGYRQAAEVRERQFGPDHPLYARALQGQAGALEYLGQLDRALEIAERVVAIQQKALGPDHPLTLSAGYVRGLFLNDVGRPAEAVEVLRKVLARQLAALGPDSPMAGDTATALALALGQTHQFEEAHRSFEVARSVAAKEKGEVSFRVAQLFSAEAEMLRDEQRQPEAVTYTQRALDLYDQAKLPPEDDRRAHALYVQGTALNELGRSREALERLERARAIREQALGKDSPFLDPVLLALGQAHTGLGQVKAATEVLEELLRRLQADPDAPRAKVARAHFALAQAAWRGGDKARGLALGEQAKQELVGETCCPKLRADVPAWLDARR